MTQRRGIGSLKRVTDAQLARMTRQRIAQSLAQQPIDPSIAPAPAALREDIDREGFAVVRGLVPPTLVDAVRERVHAMVTKGGLVRKRSADDSVFALASAPPDVGKFNTRQFVSRLAMSRPYQSLVNYTLQALRPVTGPAWPIQADHGRWLRVGLPEGGNRRMPPHQDIYYLPGAEKFLTVWVPLHRCPKELGSLRVVPRSHLYGPFSHEGRDGISVRGASLKWKQFSLEVGDAIVFHRYLVHAAGVNRSVNTVRFSVDFRLTLFE